jgi:hypothetical protein
MMLKYTLSRSLPSGRTMWARNVPSSTAPSRRIALRARVHRIGLELDAIAAEGLMRCESCGSSFVMKNKFSYQCSGFVNGKICDNGDGVRRDYLQDKLLARIGSDLLSDEAIERFTSKIRRRMTRRPIDPAAKRRTELGSEVRNLVEAGGTGLLSRSLAKRLQDAETELTALPPPSAVVRVDDLLKRLPEAVKRFRRMAARLGDAPIDVERGRAVLKGLLGPIWIAPRDGYLVAKMGSEFQPLSASSIRGSGGTLRNLFAADPTGSTASPASHRTYRLGVPPDLKRTTSGSGK